MRGKRQIERKSHLLCIVARCNKNNICISIVWQTRNSYHHLQLASIQPFHLCNSITCYFISWRTQVHTRLHRFESRTVPHEVYIFRPLQITSFQWILSACLTSMSIRLAIDTPTR